MSGNGQEALEMRALQDSDAALMDCQIPVVDGRTATRALRRLPPRLSSGQHRRRSRHRVTGRLAAEGPIRTRSRTGRRV